MKKKEFKTKVKFWLHQLENGKVYLKTRVSGKRVTNIIASFKPVSDNLYEGRAFSKKIEIAVTTEGKIRIIEE